MKALLYILFLLNGDPTKPVWKPFGLVDMSACMAGSGVQATASQFVKEDPRFTFGLRWRCTVGPEGRDA
jgi:hypothetical protein